MSGATRCPCWPCAAKAEPTRTNTVTSSVDRHGHRGPCRSPGSRSPARHPPGPCQAPGPRHGLGPRRVLRSCRRSARPGACRGPDRPAPRPRCSSMPATLDATDGERRHPGVVITRTPGEVRPSGPGGATLLGRRVLERVFAVRPFRFRFRGEVASPGQWSVRGGAPCAGRGPGAGGGAVSVRALLPVDEADTVRELPGCVPEEPLTVLDHAVELPEQLESHQPEPLD